MSSDRISQIRKRKELLDESTYRSHYEFNALCNEWRRDVLLEHSNLDVYPIRAISQLEVFTRTWVRRIVDHSKDFSARAIPLIQNIKPDYNLVLSTAQDLLTFGDVVAHTVSVSNLGHVINIFETLCSVALKEELPLVIDRWSVEVRRQDPEPIIVDYEVTCGNIAALFELRHCLCHEAPRLLKMDFSSVGNQLKSLEEYVHALEWFLNRVLYGNMPLTQTEMNIAAGNKFLEAEAEMKVVVAKLHEKYRESPRKIELLDAAQELWEKFRDAQACFIHDPEGGGTIGPLLRASEAESLTIERTKRLRILSDAKEGDF